MNLVCFVVVLAFCQAEESNEYDSRTKADDDSDLKGSHEFDLMEERQHQRQHWKNYEDEDVYWRPWTGTIPEDAVSAGDGENKCGMTVSVHLAQAIIDYPIGNPGIQPVPLYKNSKTVTATYNEQVHETNRNIKVLCSSDPEKLYWIHINQTGNVRAATDCVIAGNEDSHNLYFGRTLYEGNLKVGKVLAHKNVLYIEHLAKETPVNDDFEALCYKQPLLDKKIISEH